MTIGRAAGAAHDRRSVTVARLPALGAERRAASSSPSLLDLYDRGMREPLPLACATSAAYARGSGEAAAARKAWESEWNFAKEDAEPEHQLVLGGVLTLRRAARARRRATTSDWDPGEPTRFGRYARRLWDGLLRARGR